MHVFSKLVISVHFLTGEYLGYPEWPPSPARLFQALIAGVGAHRPVLPDTADGQALLWLERLAAPIIGAPPATWKKQGLTRHVPTNSLGEDGIARRESTGKLEQPWFFDHRVPVWYAWDIGGTDVEHAQHVVSLARHLLQLGRGTDMVWGEGRLLDEERFREYVAHYPGDVLYPNLMSSGGRRTFKVPKPGSFRSLNERFDAAAHRWVDHQHVFQSLPPAQFAIVSYGDPVAYKLYEIVHAVSQEAVRIPMPKAMTLAKQIFEAIDTKIGLDDLFQCVHVFPVPSIGHAEADCLVRRMLVLVQSKALLRKEDIFWAASRVEFAGHSLVEQENDEFLVSHYGFGRQHTTWRTALPIDVRGLDMSGIAHVHFQKEPFLKKGVHVRYFSESEHLRYATLVFSRPRTGPVFIDGKTHGPGLLFPASEPHARLWGVFCLKVLDNHGDLMKRPPQYLAAAFRRTVLSCMPKMDKTNHEFISRIIGHAFGNGGNRSQKHDEIYHWSYIFDRGSKSFWLIAPHVLYRRAPDKNDKLAIRLIQNCVEKMKVLHVDKSTACALALAPSDENSHLLRPSKKWRTSTRYVICKHWKDQFNKPLSIQKSVHTEINQECLLLNLPLPKVVVVNNWRSISGYGTTAEIELEFEVAVDGPILLGRRKHMGEGLFVSA